MGLLYDHLHRHRDEITFKTILIGEVIPEFHLHVVLIDMVHYTYCRDALKCAEHTCLHFFFRNVISAIFNGEYHGQIANPLYFRPTIISTSTVVTYRYMKCSYSTLCASTYMHTIHVGSIMHYLHCCPPHFIQ